MNDAYPAPLASGAGVNTRLPSSAARITCPAVTAVPLSSSVAPAGSVSVSILTAESVSPASTSLNPKSAAANERLASSFTVTVLSVPAGASLTAVTSMVAIAVFESPLPSLTFTATRRVTVEGLSVVFSKVIRSIASAYCAADAAPESVMTSPFAPERTQLIVPKSVPLAAAEPSTRRRSPAW